MAEGIKKISENVTVANRAFVITSPNVADNDAISIGALQSNPTQKGLKIKTSKGVYSLFNATQLLSPLTVETSLLADLSVTQQKIRDGAINTQKLGNLAVTEVKLATDSVTRSKIKNGEVIQGKLGANAVINTNLLDLCVTNNKIANNTIENSKLLDYTITNKKIAQGTIDKNCLARNSVTNEKISDSSIDYRTLAKGSVYGNKIPDNAIKQTHLANDCINNRHVMNGAIDGLKIQPWTINANHIADNQIISRHIMDWSITRQKIADGAISTPKLDDGCITIAKLSSEVIDRIGDAVKYDTVNDVRLRQHLHLPFGNIYCNGTIDAHKIFNAVFMDLAEAYTPAPDVTFVPGDIVEVREDGLAYKADGVSKNKAIVGVVSNEYAQCFGATEEELANNEKIAVGMIGKVHVNVVGPVKIGEYIGACKDGVGVSTNVDLALPKQFVIGKALESNDSADPKKVLCLIFPN